MNSLVVLFSLVVLATAKPSGLLAPEVLTYVAPAVAAIPAAVSHQSRINIKSSPAIVAAAEIAPVTRTVIAEPAVVAAPAALVPAAVSHHLPLSRPQTITSPAFVNTAAVASPTITAYAAPALINTAIATPAIANAVIAAPTGITSDAAIAAPATITPSAVPFDTPEVIAARAAHLEAKALANTHIIHKRSTTLFAPTHATYAAAPLISTYSTAPLIHPAPLAYSAPLAFHTPLITKAYSVHPY
ncbi:hypothetical protein ACJJTC_014905 [Scirpophaga incertulas]